VVPMVETRVGQIESMNAEIGGTAQALAAEVPVSAAGFDPLPEPPPIPSLFSRRGRWLVAVASSLALVLMAGLAVFLTSRAASSASTSAAKSLAMLKSNYSVAAAQLNSHAATFQAFVNNSVPANDLAGLAAAASSFSGWLTDFDDSISRMQFPASMSRAVDAMLSDDQALQLDLDGVPTDPNAPDAMQYWLYQYVSDYAADATAHDALTADLGISSTDLPGAASNTV
jgi:hypothetical protein